MNTVHLPLVGADNYDGCMLYYLLGCLIVTFCPLPPRIGALGETPNSFVLDHMIATLPTLYPYLGVIVLDQLQLEGPMVWDRLCDVVNCVAKMAMVSKADSWHFFLGHSVFLLCAASYGDVKT
jgi:hypothetical protein